MVNSIHVLSDSHPEGSFELKLKGFDKEGVVEYETCQVLAGAELTFRISFKVQNDVVH